MKYRFLLIILISLLSLSAVNAAGIIVSEESVQDEIKDGEPANFDLVIRNDDRKERDIFINFPYSTNWRVNINPYLLRIPSKGVKTANIQTFSLNDDNLGNFDIILNINSRDEEIREDFSYKIKVLPFDGDEVVAQLVVPDRIDPRVGGKIKLKLDNVRNNDFEDLEIIVKSGDFFSERRFLDLDSNEIRLEEFSFDFPETLDPGKYSIGVEVKNGNKIIGRDSEDFLLAGFSDVVERISNEGNLFVKKIVVSKINGGTEEKADKIVYTVGKFKKLFTSFSREPTREFERDEEYFAEWSMILGSGDVFKVEIVTNYVLFILSIVVVVLVAFSVMQFRKKRIVIFKKVLNVKKDREGISGMKVLLHIKNKSRRPISDIQLSDSLPSFIGTSPHGFSTLHPTKIKKTKFGNIRLIWNLEELHGGEERIISYVARSRLSIIGKLILPSAVASYKRGNRKIKSKSNKLTLLTAITELGEEES